MTNNFLVPTIPAFSKEDIRELLLNFKFTAAFPACCAGWFKKNPQNKTYQCLCSIQVSDWLH